MSMGACKGRQEACAEQPPAQSPAAHAACPIRSVPPREPPSPQTLLILWQTINDHDTLFVLAEVAHFVGVGLLGYKVFSKKSVAGEAWAADEARPGGPTAQTWFCAHPTPPPPQPNLPAGLSLQSQILTATFLGIRLYCRWAAAGSGQGSAERGPCPLRAAMPWRARPQACNSPPAPRPVLDLQHHDGVRRAHAAGPGSVGGDGVCAVCHGEAAAARGGGPTGARRVRLYVLFVFLGGAARVQQQGVGASRHDGQRQARRGPWGSRGAWAPTGGPSLRRALTFHSPPPTRAPLPVGHAHQADVPTGDGHHQVVLCGGWRRSWGGGGLGRRPVCGGCRLQRARVGPGDRSVVSRPTCPARRWCPAWCWPSLPTPSRRTGWSSG